MKTKTVHFKLGGNAGKLLMDIAQEHLIYDLDPKRAIETITESLTGCPMDVVLKILKGDWVIEIVNEGDEQLFNVVQRTKEHKDYPSLNINDWYSREHKDIGDNGRMIYRALEEIMTELCKNKSLDISFDYNKIFEFVKGNTDPILKDLQGDETIQWIGNIVRVAKNYLDITYKMWGVMDFMEKVYPEEFDLWDRESDDFNKIKDNPLSLGHHEVVDMVMIRLNNLMKQNYDEIIAKDKELTSYIDAALVIDKTLSVRIKPANILDNYSAGWLAPNGDYYGLNGEIANMLHAQIADALQEAGIVPQIDATKDVIKNTDTWLSHNGWVKIHGNHIMYESCLNDRIGLKNIDMTREQVKVIYEYGCLCHESKLKLGIELKYISAPGFEMMAENLEHLYKKYFYF